MLLMFGKKKKKQEQIKPYLKTVKKAKVNQGPQKHWLTTVVKLKSKNLKKKK